MVIFRFWKLPETSDYHDVSFIVLFVSSSFGFPVLQSLILFSLYLIGTFELFQMLIGDAVKVLHSISQQIWKIQ